jgi:hypothetical protein
VWKARRDLTAATTEIVRAEPARTTGFRERHHPREHVRIGMQKLACTRCGERTTRRGERRDNEFWERRCVELAKPAVKTGVANMKKTR